MRSTCASFRRSNSNKSASEAAAISASSPRSQTSRDTGNLSRSSTEHRAVGRMRAPTSAPPCSACRSCSAKNVQRQRCSPPIGQQLSCGNQRFPARYHCANRRARSLARIVPVPTSCKVAWARWDWSRRRGPDWHRCPAAAVGLQDRWQLEDAPHAADGRLLDATRPKPSWSVSPTGRTAPSVIRPCIGVRVQQSPIAGHRLERRA